METDTIDFLQHIESVEAEAAQVSETFSRFAAPERGERRIRGMRNPRWLKGVAAAGKLFKDVREGRRPSYLLKEAMTTSDFPLYMAGSLDRGILGAYQEAPSVWPAYCGRQTVRDFRLNDVFAFDGLEARLDKVEQQAEYPEAALAETRYQWKVDKYGRRVAFAWELLVNDDLDGFAGIPNRFAKAARRTEDFLATGLHVDANGPHASFYTAGNKNIINATNSGLPFTAVNPVLSITALQQAFAVLGKMVDADGEPIAVDMAVLEVAPANMITAQNIMNATEIRINDEVGGGGTVKSQINAQNWMRSRLTLVVNPYIPVIASTANGNTSWFLHASPSVGRPAFRVGFLRGYEEPGLYIKAPNMIRVGGGDVSPFEGDFDTDSIEQKVRHVVGGTRLDPKASIASNGSGA